MQRKVKIHLDTDLGADTDDLCALVYLLRNPCVELTGVTTCLERGGKRRAYVREVLQMAGADTALAAGGADRTWSGRKDYGFTFAHEERMFGKHYPEEADYKPEAVEAMRRSLEAGAVLVSIGPLTNVAELERAYPGMLGRDNFYFMGGAIGEPEEGLPQWGAENDWNIHMDLAAASYVLNRVPVTMVPVAATLKAHLTERDCRVLDGEDALCRLMAAQARAWREVSGFIRQEVGRCSRLPRDLCNFQYDPLTAALAAGYGPYRAEEIRIRLETDEARGTYRIAELREPEGRGEAPVQPGGNGGENSHGEGRDAQGQKVEGNRVRVIREAGGSAFAAHWLDCVTKGK